jgi:hypothetical protein
MRDTSSNTLSTPRHFANAIRRARRLAKRTVTSSSPDLLTEERSNNEIPAKGKGAVKRVLESNDDIELKRPCLKYSHILEENECANKQMYTNSPIKFQPATYTHLPSAAQTSQQSPHMRPSQSSGHNLEQQATAAQIELLRMIITSLSPPPPPQSLMPTKVGSDLLSCAFLQGAAWAATKSQQQPLPFSPALLPPFLITQPALHIASGFSQPLANQSAPHGGCLPPFDPYLMAASAL